MARGIGPRRSWSSFGGEYAPMFAIDLETATPSHFNGAFRKAFPAADAVVQKCVTFFLYAANDAGVKISGRVLKGRKPRSPTPRRKQASAHAPAKEFEAGASRPQPDTARIEGKTAVGNPAHAPRPE